MEEGVSPNQKVRKVKRISDIDPEIRKQIPALFDRKSAEEIVRSVKAPKPEIIEDVLRDTRRSQCRLRDEIRAIRAALPPEIIRSLDGGQYRVVNSRI